MQTMVIEKAKLIWQFIAGHEVIASILLFYVWEAWLSKTKLLKANSTNEVIFNALKVVAVGRLPFLGGLVNSMATKDTVPQPPPLPPPPQVPPTE